MVYFVFFIVPLFADSETKKIINSVKIKKFWLPDICLYEFSNLDFADKVINLNESNIVQ